LQQTLVAVTRLAAAAEGHDLETGMWIWTTRTPSTWKIDAVVCKHDERIVVDKTHSRR